jgi:hypothetical protein
MRKVARDKKKEIWSPLTLRITSPAPSFLAGYEFECGRINQPDSGAPDPEITYMYVGNS